MEGCNNIIKNDCITLQTRLHRRQQRAVKVGPNPKREDDDPKENDSDSVSTFCSFCNGDLFAGKLEAIVTFFCRHSFHSNCFESQRISKRQKLECLVCSKHRRIGSTVPSSSSTSTSRSKVQESGSPGGSPVTTTMTSGSNVAPLSLGPSGVSATSLASAPR